MKDHLHSFQKRCGFCGRFFCPDSHVGDRQKACSDPVCQKRRKRDQEKRWIRRWEAETGEVYFRGGYERVREWRKTRPAYQREWRARQRAKKRPEIQTQFPGTVICGKNPIKSMRFHLKTSKLLGEIQTQFFRVTRSGSDFWVDGLPMQPWRDTNADGLTPPG